MLGSCISVFDSAISETFASSQPVDQLILVRESQNSSKIDQASDAIVFLLYLIAVVLLPQLAFVLHLYIAELEQTLGRSPSFYGRMFLLSLPALVFIVAYMNHPARQALLAADATPNDRAAGDPKQDIASKSASECVLAGISRVMLTLLQTMSILPIPRTHRRSRQGRPQRKLRKCQE
jgi:hypothetical protein